MSILVQPIDTANLATISQNGLFQLTDPVWTFGGNLYCAVKINSLPNDAAAVYKSTDDGVTWIEQDAANHPANSSSFNNFYNSATGVCAFIIGPRSDQGDVALRYYFFNCNTDTWNLVSGAGPVAHFASYVGLTSTGDAIVAYGTVGTNDLWLASYSAGVWNVIQDLTLVSSLLIRSYDVYGCVDSADTVHIFFHDTTNTAFWHASVIALALGTVDTLPVVSQIGGAIALGANILLAVSESNAPKLLVGTPLIAPVFALTAAIDAFDVSTPKVGYDSTNNKLLLLYGDNTTLLTFTLAQTADLTGASGWTSALVYDANTDPTPANFNAAFGIFPTGAYFDGAGSIYLLSDYDDTVLAAVTSFYIGVFLLTPSGSTSNPRLNAYDLPPIPLPPQQTMNNTGAASACYPLKKKGCLQWY